MGDLMIFPDTVEEFMEQYKMIDTEQIYSNGTEYVPIFRMKQWFEHLPAAESEIIRCKDCKHKPHTSDKYDYDNGDCGFEIIFPDHRCPCQCEDRYYNRIPDDDWYCGNAERREDG